jgi:DNA-binding MarR family transcriptional regulator
MDDDDRTLGVIETEIARLMRLGEATRRATALAPHRALDRAAYVLLRELQAAGSLSISALADRLNLDGSTVTRQVAVLERDGLVAREPDPTDGRSSLIAATPVGLKNVDAVRAARRELYGTLLADWTDADRRQLGELLDRLNAALHAHVRRR